MWRPQALRAEPARQRGDDDLDEFARQQMTKALGTAARAPASATTKLASSSGPAATAAAGAGSGAGLEGMLDAALPSREASLAAVAEAQALLRATVASLRDGHTQRLAQLERLRGDVAVRCDTS